MDHFSCRFSSLISTVVLLFLASDKGGVLASPSQKSTSYSTPTTEGTPSQGSVTGSGLGYAGTGSDTAYGAGSGTGSGGATMLADGSWLAGLAMGDSYKTASPSALQSTMVAFTTSLVIIVSFHFLVALGPFLSVSWLLLLNENSFQICSLDGCRILPLSGKLTDSLIQIVNHPVI
ncbi:hypothetical protein OIU76_015533 [Salix suchowensis]|nr:hypothetical protein OIU76_015533 [Salix suchowensis]